MSVGCQDVFTCDELLGLTPEAVLKMLAVKDSNGCAALNTVVVTADDPQELAVDCDTVSGWQTLVMQMLTKDSNNKLALRIVVSS